jgi:hypothetical protein
MMSDDGTSLVADEGTFGSTPPSDVVELSAELEAKMGGGVHAPSMSEDSTASYDDIPTTPHVITKSLFKTFSAASLALITGGKTTKVDNGMVDAAGYMVKRGKRVHSWKRRYFVLCGRSFSYFTDSSLNAQCGGGKVIRVGRWEGCEKGFGLFLTDDKDRIFQLVCDSEKDQVFWLQHLNRASTLRDDKPLQKKSSAQNLLAGGGRAAFIQRQEDSKAKEQEAKRLEEAKKREEVERAEQQRLEEEQRAKEEEERRKEEEAAKYKAHLVAGVAVKKHHLRKKGDAPRVLWIDDNLTWLYVALKKSDSKRSSGTTAKRSSGTTLVAKKQFLIKEIVNVTPHEKFIKIAEVFTGKGQVLKIEMESEDERDKFVQYFTGLRYDV